jgi:hypothetical protein
VDVKPKICALYEMCCHFSLPTVNYLKIPITQIPQKFVKNSGFAFPNEITMGIFLQNSQKL